MFVEVGITEAIQIESTLEGIKRSRKSGEFTTQFKFPDGHTVEEAARDVIGALVAAHMANDRPVWIESDNKALRDILCAHFSVDKRRKKTATWGLGPSEPEGDLDED